MNALFMGGAAGVTAVLLALGLRTTDLYLGIGVMNIGVALWSCRLLPAGAWSIVPRILRR
jgi:hypothetical protein